MPTAKSRSIQVLVLLAVAAISAASVSPAENNWVKTSDAHTRFFLDAIGRFAPETVASMGAQGLDEMISQLSDEFDKQARRAFLDLLAVMEGRHKRETHPEVRKDLEILINVLKQNIEETELNRRLFLPYEDPVRMIFMGIMFLLDDQVAEARRPAAIVRLRRYTGLETDWTPVMKQAEENLRRALKKPGLLRPFRDQLELDLKSAPQYIAGIKGLIDQYKLTGGAEALAALEKQNKDWAAFVRQDILPQARTDHRLPAAYYRFKLKENGIDMPLEELVNRSLAAYREIQNEMRTIAALVAEKRGWAESDYRRVIQNLKKEQLSPEQAIPRYRERIDALARIAGQEKIATFPSRDLRIRLATEAESTLTPGPSMRLPPMIGNKGEMGEFVVALGRSGGPAIDDFTHEAAIWTLAAHEGRPGHEMQFARVLESGVSNARALFGINTANADGWALYIEAEMKSYFPLEGQLISLQFRLLRAARAYLDPGLQTGDITPETALRILTRDVVLSEPLARLELERYMNRKPGQAPAYFCGYSRMMELRAEVERLLGENFDQQKYHDFLMGLGSLPMAMVRRIVLEEFVPAVLGRAKAG